MDEANFDIGMKGKGNRPCRKRAPTENELNEMWDKRALGCNSPHTLQHTVWWIMSTRFGKRANKENYDMRWGDVEVRENEDGRQYLINKERSTKTRQGDNISDIKNEIKVFEDKEKPEYCPVQIFNKYENRRPADMCLPESNFYLQPKAYSSPETMEKDPTWYKKQVLQKICFKFTILRKMIIFIVHVIPFSNICTRMMLPFLFFINKVTILLSQSILSQLILSAILKLIIYSSRSSQSQAQLHLIHRCTTISWGCRMYNLCLVYEYDCIHKTAHFRQQLCRQGNIFWQVNIPGHYLRLTST